MNLVNEVPNKDEVTADIDTYYQDAITSMEEWERKYDNAIRLVTLDPEEKQKNFPIENASTVMMPFILEAAIDFHSRAVADLVYAPKLASCKVINATDFSIPPELEGTPEGEQVKQLISIQQAQQNNAIEARSERVETYLNYQLTKKIPSWRKTQDKLLLMLPTVGTVFKKVFYDPDIKGVRSEMVAPDRLKFDHSCDCFEDVRHKFLDMDLDKNELISRIRGDGWDIEESDLGDDEVFRFCEALTWIDMDEDGLEEPYICIYWKDQSKLVSVVPNYDEDSITYNDAGDVVSVTPIDYYIQYTFMPDPAGGCMGMGWGILLSDMFDTINTNVRQLLDAGTLSNVASNSGFIDVGMGTDRMQSGAETIEMGRFKKMKLPTGKSLRESVVQLPFAGVQPALFQLLDYLVNQARGLTVSAYNVEANSGEAAQLYLARLQQGLKVPNTIVMRVYECATEEFRRIARLNYEHYDNEMYSNVINQPGNMQADFNYEDCDVTPVANPTQGSDIERIAKAQSVYEIALQSQDMNQYEAKKRLFEAMGVDNIEEVLPEPDPNYVDPMQSLLMQQKAAEMELYNREISIRERNAATKELELAIKYEEMLTDIDKTESETTKNYAQTIETLAKTSRENALAAMDRAKLIEESFFNKPEGGLNAATNNQRRNVPMVGQQGNEGLPINPQGGFGGVPEGAL